MFWLLPTSVVIITASILIASVIASRAASAAYDQGLRDAAQAFAERIRANRALIPDEIPPDAERMLTPDPEDRAWFRVQAADGSTLAGDPQLPVQNAGLEHESIRFGNSVFQGRDIRVVTLRFDAGRGDLLLTIGSTMAKRDVLIREILLGLSVPELVLFFAMILLMEVAIERGLSPLNRLRDELSSRSHMDLSPVSLDEVPDELQALAREVNELLERLESSISAQNNFVSDAAHQLRTPIAALQAQAEILLRDSSQNLQRERLCHLVSASARLSHLVGQILALARAEPSPRSIEDIDLPALIKETAEDVFPRAIAAGIDLGFDLHPVRMRGSPVLIREAITNLVDNAIRYTPSPGSATVRCMRERTDAIIEVEDSGPGIPESERESVFERFHRLPGNSAEGSGLGLAIVREIVRTHGGTVAATGRKGLPGSRFVVRLPAL